MVEKSEAKEKKPVRIPVVEGEWQGRKVRFRPDRVVLKLRPSPLLDSEESIKAKCEEICAELPGGRILRFSKKTLLVVLELPEDSAIVELAEKIAQREDVKYAEPDFVGRVSATPNDPLFGNQWGLKKINAEAAWDLETGAANVLIAIIDTGIALDDSGSLTHPDLDDPSRYVLGTDFVEEDRIPDRYGFHGTLVTGVAAAETNNCTGMAGMNWNSPVYICTAFPGGTEGAQSDVAAALEEIVDYAVANNLRAVICMSAGFRDESPTLWDACRYVNDNGMLYCAAVGNGCDLHETPDYPAKYSLLLEAVIAVGSTERDDSVCSGSGGEGSHYSNSGPEVTVVAPGRDIMSTMPSQGYLEFHGTSMACPLVAGTASLVWSREPRQTNSQVRDVLVNTAVKLGPIHFDDLWGYGRIDAGKAVAKSGWSVINETPSINFIDVVAGETVARAARFSVKSFHAVTFEVVSGLTDTFRALSGVSVTLQKTTDYDTPREACLWLSYTGATPGDFHSGSVRIRCVETDQTWDIPVTANTIGRPTACIMMVFDRSRSMGYKSGIAGMDRIDVLRCSANILVDVVQEMNGVGIVAFDQDAHDVLIPVVGPIGASRSSDSDRRRIHSAINMFRHNPEGTTSIGDGIQRGYERLSAVSGYDVEAMLVLTDGPDDIPGYTSEFAGLAGERIHAVGLGTAEAIRPRSLTAITNSAGGHTLLTGRLDNESLFKPAEYFLRILAEVMNEDVVARAEGWVSPGSAEKIPFHLNEADISSDIILMVPSKGVVDMQIEAPNGSMITSAAASSFPAVYYASGENVTLCRLKLPVPSGAARGVCTGLWHAVLRVGRVSTLPGLPSWNNIARAHGVPYTLLVHCYSAVRMKATLAQSGYSPGAEVNLNVTLTEYHAPLVGDASVQAKLRHPDGSLSTVSVPRIEPGTFGASFMARQPGVYEVRVIADGLTTRGRRFTRERLLTAATWEGGDLRDLYQLLGRRPEQHER